MKNMLIITGGSKGIGFATALHFISNHWQVFNISRTPSEIEGVTNINIDLSDPSFELKLSEKLESILPQKAVICLVHNAAYHVNDTVMNQNPSQLTKALTVSIISPSIINQILIPFMQEGSSIIYLGSTLSEKAVPNTASYTTIKHATIGMMRATCQDLAKKKIHTACICPGFTNTDMLQQHLSHDSNLVTLAKQKVSFERFIEPSEIAELIYFSAKNAVINGSVIHANLGQLET
ncbi:SDR family oxidoreductase [Legionella sp. CNM-1927-20]|uniref:SDR family oxidoreductase n=1 Tax=Legionella sp. CNM-1927-20 TaxID=3422221 RepID=UPI00403AB305